MHPLLKKLEITSLPSVLTVSLAQPPAVVWAGSLTGEAAGAEINQQPNNTGYAVKKEAVSCF
jgi:hypothetical protein